MDGEELFSLVLNHIISEEQLNCKASDKTLMKRHPEVFKVEETITLLLFKHTEINLDPIHTHKQEFGLIIYAFPKTLGNHKTYSQGTIRELCLHLTPGCWEGAISSSDAGLDLQLPVTSGAGGSQAGHVAHWRLVG
jgi:hypothetical protein